MAIPWCRTIGLSRDQRTQRWQVSCVCGHLFEPITTMFATQRITCPSCSKELVCDYNAEPPRVREG